MLYEDDVFVESAVLTLDDLHRIPFLGARTLWRSDQAPQDVALPADETRRAPRPV